MNPLTIVLYKAAASLGGMIPNFETDPAKGQGVNEYPDIYAGNETPSALLPGLHSSWDAPQQAAGVPPVPGAGADWTTGAPAPAPIGGDLGTPDNPVPEVTPESMFAKQHGGAFDPNSRVDRAKMDVIRKQLDPSWGMTQAPIVSNDSLNPPVQAAGVPAVPGAGAPLELPGTPPAAAAPSLVDQSWDQLPGPEFSQPPDKQPSLSSAPLTDLSWEDVPGTDVTPGSQPVSAPPPVSPVEPSPDPISPPAPPQTAAAPPVVDPSWGSVAGADMSPAPAPAAPSVSQPPPPQATPSAAQAPTAAPPPSTSPVKPSLQAPAGQELVGMHSGQPVFAPISQPLTPPPAPRPAPKRYRSSLDDPNNAFSSQAYARSADMTGDAAAQARNSGQLGAFFAARGRPELAKAFPSPISDAAATKLTGLAPKTNTTYRSAPAAGGMKSSIVRRPGR